MRSTTSSGRAVAATAAVLLFTTALAGCGLPPGGGGPGEIRLFIISQFPIPLVRSGTTGLFEADFIIEVTNDTADTFEGSDVSVTHDGLAYALSVGAGSCFASGVAAGGMCQVIPHLQAPASSPNLETDDFTLTVHLGSRSGSIDLTATVFH